MNNDLNLIRDDEICPCGSGLNFNKCCKLNIINSEKVSIEQFKNNKHITNFLREEYKESNLLLCLHPKHNECAGIIINAHSIQNNRILSKLAVKEHVMVIDHVSEIRNTKKSFILTEEYINNMISDSSESFSEQLKEQLAKVDKRELEKYYGRKFEYEIEQAVLKYEVERKGKNKATVFTGFCKYHDSIVFSPIEDYDYNDEMKQDFLFAYRAFSQEYHEKLRVLKGYRKIFKLNPGLYNDTKFILDYRYRQLDEKYMNELKTKFDQAIINEDYDTFETIRIRLPKAYDFAVTAMISPEIDLEGDVLSDRYLLKNSSCKSLYLTVFPNGCETIVLMSWLKEDSIKFSNYGKQLIGLNESELKCYLNNLIPTYTPNIVLSPRLWEKQSEKEKDKFLKSFEKGNQEIIYSQSEPIKLSEKRKETLRTYDRFLCCTEYDLFR